MHVKFGSRFQDENYISEYNTEDLQHWQPPKSKYTFLPGQKETFPIDPYAKNDTLIVVEPNSRRIVDVKKFDHQLCYGNMKEAVETYLEEQESRFMTPPFYI